MTNKYYQENKEKLQKEVCKKHKNLSEEEKEKRFSIIVNVIRFFQRNKKRGKLSMEEIII